MSRPVYYLWKTDDITEEQFREEKQYYENLGYLVIIYKEGNKDIHKSLQDIIKNHITD